MRMCQLPYFTSSLKTVTAHTRTILWKALQKYCWEQRNWQKQKAKEKTYFQLQKVWIHVYSLLYLLYIVNIWESVDGFKYGKLHTMMWSIVWVFCMNCDPVQHLTLVSSLDRSSWRVFRRHGILKKSCSVKTGNLKAGLK